MKAVRSVEGGASVVDLDEPPAIGLTKALAVELAEVQER